MAREIITRTVNAGGTLSGELTLFAEQSRRVMLDIRVIGTGALFVSIGEFRAETGEGIYVDADQPLHIEMPVSGAVHIISDGSGSVQYTAAEGLC